MAKAIEPTPILEGEDAEILLEELNNTVYSESKATFLTKCVSAYNTTKKR